MACARAAADWMCTSGRLSPACCSPRPVARRRRPCARGATIKLGDVATNVLGRSARQMLEAIVAGATDAEAALYLRHDGCTALAQLARGRLREKIPQLETCPDRPHPLTHSWSTWMPSLVWVGGPPMPLRGLRTPTSPRSSVAWPCAAAPRRPQSPSATRSWSSSGTCSSTATRTLTSAPTTSTGVSNLKALGYHVNLQPASA